MTVRITLTNKRSGKVLDLSQISDRGAGVEVGAGMTGLGLPSVDVQWFESAADGALFRNSRAQPRDMDLPLNVWADNRTDLKAKVREIAAVLDGQMTLRIYDGVNTWRTDVIRAGGGDYTYGTETDGLNQWSSIVTLRAGDPYWYFDTAPVTALNVSVPIAQFANKANTISVQGSAPVKPVWTVKGPATGFSLTNADGDNIFWTGDLLGSDTITIDTAKGTCVDQNGVNRYSSFGTAPRMFPLYPGASTVTTTVFGPPVASTRTNYYLNPRMTSTYMSQWAVTGGTWNYLVGNTGGLTLSNPAAPSTAIIRVSFPTTLAGTSMVVSGTLYYSGTWNPAAKQSVFQAQVPGGSPLIAKTALTTGTDMVPFSLSFTATSSGYVDLTLVNQAGVSGLTLALNSLYVGTPGSYFNGTMGTSPDGLITYSWSGTADNSTSILTASASGNPTVTATYTPRDWLVV